MYKTLLKVIFLSFIGTCLYDCSQSKKDTSSFNIKDVPVIELNGTGYERGLQHGEKLKSEIAEVFKKWKMDITLTTHRNADSVIAEFLKTTNFEPTIKKWTPEILEEVKGIAKGSGQKFNDVLSFQLVDEFWVYLDKLANYKTDHCSSIGVSAIRNQPTFIAQNMDLENYMNGYQKLLHVIGTITEPEQYILTCAGLIAATGMNEAGIGICCNTLMELQASENGLPVAFIVRGILSKSNGNDALFFLNNVRHASGQNYIIGIQDSVYDFESSSNQIIRFYPNGNQSGIVYHTNHALVNNDIKPWYLEYHKNILSGGAKNTNSVIRFNSLEKRLEKPPEEISMDVIKTILASKDDEKNPVCRPYQKGGTVFTFSSVLYTLTGKRSVQITCGSPDQSEYKEHFFRR